jgi:MerR family redox-sensitive transcriptional activator SoxR
MKNLGIGEIARRSGIATSTIRYYERIGLLPPSKRVSGKRRYDASILQKIGLIRLAKQAGLTIEEIQTLLYEFPVDTPPSERWTVLATKKITELDALMAQIQAMKAILEQTLSCECPTLDDCGADEQLSKNLLG